MITIRLPFDSPPLRSNQRLHWAKKAAITREIRMAAHLRALLPLSTRLDALASIGEPPYAVTLIWEVTDKRRRDVGASSGTLKAALDGIVDAGLLTADDHTVVGEERLRIEVGDRRGVRIEIEPSRIAEVIPQLTEGQQ